MYNKYNTPKYTISTIKHNIKYYTKSFSLTKKLTICEHNVYVLGNEKVIFLIGENNKKTYYLIILYIRKFVWPIAKSTLVPTEGL